MLGRNDGEQNVRLYFGGNNDVHSGRRDTSDDRHSVIPLRHQFQSHRRRNHRSPRCKQFARPEAIKEGQPVTVCVSTDALTCTGGVNWENGWIVFSDAHGNATVDGADALLRVQKTFASTDTFRATNTVTAVTFNRMGYANGIANGTLIALHDATNTTNWTRCLSINLAGMMLSQTYGTANGVTCN